MSATYRLSNESIVRPFGFQKLAALPTPSALPLTLLILIPANVVTSYVTGSILRIELFPVSATNILPNLSNTMPLGPLNLATAPIPFVIPERPDGEPAIVVTIPVVVIIRMALFPVSAT